MAGGADLHPTSHVRDICMRLCEKAARRPPSDRVSRRVGSPGSRGDDPFEALATYLRRALELRISAVMPQVLELLDPSDTEISRARDASAEAVSSLVDEAHKSGDLPADVTFLDIGMMLVQIARPLPGPMSSELKDELARRHLDLFIRGLRVPAEHELAGPQVTGEQLAEAAHDPTASSTA